MLGAVLLRYLNDALSRGSTQSSLYIGIVLMLVVYFAPDELVGLWRRAQSRWRTSRTTPDAAAGLATENVEAL